jgi:membrane protein DedA with SNARE-associated domain
MSLVKLLLTHFTYLALIVVLVVAGVGVPIPEDVPLIFSGYLCNKVHSPLTAIVPAAPGDPDDTPPDADTVIPPVIITSRVPHIYLMMIAGMIGVLAGDSIVFSIGRKGVTGTSFVARHLQKVMHSKRREKVERHFARHGNLTVFTGRFLPGARSIVFAFAGMSRMSYLRFLLIDGIAAAISVPLFILIGFFCAGGIERLFHRIDHVKHIVLPILLVAGAGIGVLYYLRRRRAAPAVDHL